MPWFKAGPLFSNAKLLKETYQNKLTTPDIAVKCIESSFNVVVPLGCGEPSILLEALVQRKNELRDVKIYQMLPLTKASYFNIGLEKYFRHVSWLTSGISKRGVQEGRAGVMPGYFHEYPKFIRESLDVDVFMGTVSPMDEHGFFSFGVSVDYTMAAVEKADKVILVVNSHMPRTLGAGFIHLSQADYIIENDDPIPEIPTGEPNPRDLAIADAIAELVEDGSTIQLGLGTTSYAVAQALKSKRGLGVHTQFITDGIVDLVDAGAISNRRKSINPGKIICTSAAGTARLYHFINNNPMVEMHPASYTNDPHIIARNRKMISVNCGAEVDLLGQVCSETIGPKNYSGTGGQVDFARGTANSPGGKSFIALYSTNYKGVSSIVPALSHTTVVSISKNDVDYVVTEYGAVRLKGCTVKQRAERLIAIAHPDHRDGLTEAARKMGLTR